MYRAAPPAHVLFPGDILVVPYFGAPSADPQLVTEDGATKMLECRKCDVEYPPADPPPCPKCGKQWPEVKRRFKGAKARLGKGEHICENKDDAQTAMGFVKVVAAVILSDGCDIDNREHIRFAVVQPMADWNDDHKRAIRESRVPAMFLLPPHADLPEAAVNLDMQFFLPSSRLGHSEWYQSAETGHTDHALFPFKEVAASRRASLDEEGLRGLHAAVIRHMTRADKIEVPLKPNIFALDANRPSPEKQKENGWWWPAPKWFRPAAVAAAAG